MELTISGMGRVLAWAQKSMENYDFAKEVVLSFTLDFDDYDCAVVAGPELKGEFHQPPRDGLRSGALLVKEV